MIPHHRLAYAAPLASGTRFALLSTAPHFSPFSVVPTAPPRCYSQTIVSDRTRRPAGLAPALRRRYPVPTPTKLRLHDLEGRALLSAAYAPPATAVVTGTDAPHLTTPTPSAYHHVTLTSP